MYEGRGYETSMPRSFIPQAPHHGGSHEPSGLLTPPSTQGSASFTPGIHFSYSLSAHTHHVTVSVAGQPISGAS
jgi:hypothetical protein